jgi:hypothetical protein
MPAAKTESIRPKGAGRHGGDAVPAAPRGCEAPSSQPRPRDGGAAQSSAALSPFTPIAEEFDTSSGQHLGNFPQVFSRLALIEAAARIILAERLEEISG